MSRFNFTAPELVCSLREWLLPSEASQMFKARLRAHKKKTKKKQQLHFIGRKNPVVWLFCTAVKYVLLHREGEGRLLPSLLRCKHTGLIDVSATSHLCTLPLQIIPRLCSGNGQRKRWVRDMTVALGSIRPVCLHLRRHRCRVRTGLPPHAKEQM